MLENKLKSIKGIALAVMAGGLMYGCAETKPYYVNPERYVCSKIEDKEALLLCEKETRWDRIQANMRKEKQYAGKYYSRF